MNGAFYFSSLKGFEVASIHASMSLSGEALDREIFSLLSNKSLCEPDDLDHITVLSTYRTGQFSIINQPLIPFDICMQTMELPVVRSRIRRQQRSWISTFGLRLPIQLLHVYSQSIQM